MLVALAEDLGFVPNTHGVSQPSITQVPGDLIPSDPAGTKYAQSSYKCTETKHKVNKSF